MFGTATLCLFAGDAGAQGFSSQTASEQCSAGKSVCPAAGAESCKEAPQKDSIKTSFCFLDRIGNTLLVAAPILRVRWGRKLAYLLARNNLINMDANGFNFDIPMK